MSATSSDDARCTLVELVEHPEHAIRLALGDALVLLAQAGAVAEVLRAWVAVLSSAALRASDADAHECR